MAKRIWLGYQGGQLYCCAGRPNSCSNLQLLQAEASAFHDRTLIELTDQINTLLKRARRSAPRGKHLALIDAKDGLCFVWAEAIERPEDIHPFVRATSPPREIREFLKLEPV